MAGRVENITQGRGTGNLQIPARAIYIPTSPRRGGPTARRPHRAIGYRYTCRPYDFQVSQGIALYLSQSRGDGGRGYRSSSCPLEGIALCGGVAEIVSPIAVQWATEGRSDGRGGCEKWGTIFHRSHACMACLFPCPASLLLQESNRRFRDIVFKDVTESILVFCGDVLRREISWGKKFYNNPPAPGGRVKQVPFVKLLRGPNWGLFFGTSVSPINGH